MSKTQAKSGMCLPSLLFVSQVWCECTSEGFKLKGCTCAMIQPESKTIFRGNQDHASIRTMPPLFNKTYFILYHESKELKDFEIISKASLLCIRYNAP